MSLDEREPAKRAAAVDLSPSSSRPVSAGSPEFASPPVTGSPPAHLDARTLLGLQRAAGNVAVGRLVQGWRPAPKPTGVARQPPSLTRAPPHASSASGTLARQDYDDRAAATQAPPHDVAAADEAADEQGALAGGQAAATAGQPTPPSPTSAGSARVDIPPLPALAPTCPAVTVTLLRPSGQGARRPPPFLPIPPLAAGRFEGIAEIERFAGELARDEARRRRPRGTQTELHEFVGERLARLQTDYADTMAGAIARFNPRQWQPRMWRAIERVEVAMRRRPRVRRGETPPPAPTEEQILTALEQERCVQYKWVAGQLDSIRRGWMIGRREELDFQTLMDPRIPALRNLRPAGGAMDRVSIEPYGMGTDVHPALRDFLHVLHGNPASTAPGPTGDPPAGVGLDNRFSANNYSHEHGSGHVAGLGLSVDLHLNGERDDRGFYRFDDAVAILMRVHDTATALGGNWLALYNDFSVAAEVNRRTNGRHVTFVGTVSRTRGTGQPSNLVWHGPLVLHIHIDFTPAGSYGGGPGAVPAAAAGGREEAPAATGGGAERRLGRRHAERRPPAETPRGNGAGRRLLRQDPQGGGRATGDEDESQVDVGESTLVLWFRRDSTALRQDARADSVTHLALATASVRDHLHLAGDAGQIVLHGYASEEGSEAHNLGLSQARAERVKTLLVQAGIAADRIAAVGRGQDRSLPGLAWNRRVVVELRPTVTRIEFRQDEEVDARAPRAMTADERGALGHLTRLTRAARAEGTSGPHFALAVDDLRATLRTQLQAVRDGDPLPDDVAIVMRALILWSTDPGNRWGEGTWDSTDVTLSAADYATIPAEQNKCNAYVAEVVHQAVGVVHLAHASAEQPGRYFPHRAREWGDPAVAIRDFRVVSTPVMGDVWSSGSHVGVYLGEYAGQRLYVSARDDSLGVFGLDVVQHTHGIQIKAMPSGGVFRRYSP